MDLGAYIQIEDLDKIAKENGIEVPRLRGYRLMKNEEVFDIRKIDKKKIALDCVEELCCGEPFWNPNADMVNFDCLTDYICDYFMVKNKEDDGHTYYDIRYALNNYEKLITEKQSQISSLNTKIRELKEDLDNLHQNYPSLKQAIMGWMAYQESDGSEK